MANVALNPEIADEVPWSDQVTDYDEQHLVVYLRLLDARSAGASDAEIARIVLGIDPQREPERAQKALTSHIRRAQWMTTQGYKHLLQTE
ncbi:MAG: DUF2285 domain-containing protein [Rhodospirillaceae bacterium]|nr:DUF2285 domain-containing protein [Rhodospirillaceae bacterium]